MIDPIAFELKLAVPDFAGEGAPDSTIVESPPTASGDSKTGLTTGFFE